MLKKITESFILVFFIGHLVSCNKQSPEPLNKILPSQISTRIEEGTIIYNPVNPGDLQKPGPLVDWEWGRNSRSCAGFGICVTVCVCVDYSKASNPVVGQGTGFINQPVNIDSSTGLGISRIIFTRELSNMEEIFTVDEPLDFGSELSEEMGGFNQITILPNQYEFHKGDGESSTNPFGYVDVTVLCK